MRGTKNDPMFVNWDQDETALAERVLGTGSGPRSRTSWPRRARRIAADFASLPVPRNGPRPGRRSDGASFTVETFGRYFMHDPIHHLLRRHRRFRRRAERR